MKRILSLALFFFLSISVFAQEEIEFAQKTRYIYLWDVTYSTVDWGITTGSEEICNFLIKDITNKQNSEDEIIVIPFHDSILKDRIIKHTAKDFNNKYSGQRDSIKVYGYNWAIGHTVKGKTNVVAALKYARTEYANNTDYNNIIILLTDGMNEYADDGTTTVKDKDKGREYLRKEIEKLDSVITENVNSGKYFSTLFYVVFYDRTKDSKTGEIITSTDTPSTGAKKGWMESLSNTHFIMPDQNSINLQFVGLTPKIKSSEKGDGYHMNLRDSEFYIRFEPEHKIDILKNSGKTLKVKVTSLSEKFLNYEKICEINYDDRSIKVNGIKFNNDSINADCEIDIKLEITNCNEFEDVKGSDDYIKVWLEKQELQLKVTRNFKPQITIKVKE